MSNLAQQVRADTPARLRQVESESGEIAMQNHSQSSGGQRPAFHFFPIGPTQPIRFHVLARLADGQAVLIGRAATREDAEAIARQVPAGHARAEIVELSTAAARLEGAAEASDSLPPLPRKGLRREGRRAPIRQSGSCDGRSCGYGSAE